MSKFNLTEEPWIPCLMPNGTPKQFSLYDVLAQAHDIREIYDDSPLVVVSLHRLLLAILHRNFGPKTFDEWKTLWRKGFWDAEKLKVYFESENCKNRFNLFDEERPFYQYPKVAKKDGSESDKLPVETLMQEKATGANATLFDHSFKAKEAAYTPAQAARYLVARQSFSLAGGVSYPFNLSNGLLVKGFSVLATDKKSLFKTLALNLVVYSGDDPIQIQEDDNGVSLDKPFWERDVLQEAKERNKDGTVPLGYLDYLTWQSRRIKLLPEADFKSIKFCQLQQNFKLKESSDVLILDPFKVYAEGEKDKGLYAIDFRSDKALWRNSHTLIRQTKIANEKTNLFKHLADVSSAINKREIEGQREYSLSIIGIINDQASVESWMYESLPIPLDYFDDDKLPGLLKTAIQFAEDVRFQVLRTGIKELAAELETDMANFQAIAVYWSRLEFSFQKLLSNLPDEGDAAMRKWFKTVDDTANRAFWQSANSLSGAAREQKAIVKARKEFNKERKALLHGNKRKSGNSTYRFYLSIDENGGEE
ncbi:MAG: type I-E CRISPR-associated protein Cse1/CasA [Acidobacteriota bacterium]|nr:type I-E CRISPR-associated protein Cse1/CasA [Acidobacteriota bacterium]